MTELTGWTSSVFSQGGIEHVLYQKGTGPGILVMHELPGMTPACVKFGERLVEAGFTVWMPLLFGGPNNPQFRGFLFSRCIWREIHLFRANSDHPIVHWLALICQALHTQTGGPGVGVVGMCLTGNFAITLIADPSVWAPVTCQPALTSFRPYSLGMTEDQLASAKTRAFAENIPLWGTRFANDKTCRRPTFDRLASEFSHHFLDNEIPGRGHGVFTGDFNDADGSPTKEKLIDLLQHLHERLDR